MANEISAIFVLRMYVCTVGVSLLCLCWCAVWNEMRLRSLALQRHMSQIVIVIQANAKGFLQRKLFAKAKAAAIAVQVCGGLL